MKPKVNEEAKKMTETKGKPEAEEDGAEAAKEKEEPAAAPGMARCRIS